MNFELQIIRPIEASKDYLNEWTIKYTCAVAQFYDKQKYIMLINNTKVDSDPKNYE